MLICSLDPVTELEIDFFFCPSISLASEEIANVSVSTSPVKAAIEFGNQACLSPPVGRFGTDESLS